MSDLKVSELSELLERLRARDDDDTVEAADTIASLTLEVAQLKQRVAELEGATRHYCENYLLDEHDDAELCLNAKHHQSVVALFAALKESPHVR